MNTEAAPRRNEVAYPARVLYRPHRGLWLLLAHRRSHERP